MTEDYDEYTDALVATIKAEQSIRRLTNQQLADGAGVPWTTLKRYLAGTNSRGLPVRTALAIAGALDMPPSALFLRTEQRMEQPDWSVIAAKRSHKQVIEVNPPVSDLLDDE